MMQGTTVSDHMIIQTKYTWDVSQCFPFESTWSYLQKFGGLNACGARDIQREFGIASKRQHPQNWSDRDRDLHGWGALDPSIMKEALQLTDVQVRTAQTRNYIRPEEIKALASRSLRYCASCITTGFHTPLHQLLITSTCPIHNTMLLNTCLHCGKPTPLYALLRQTFYNPYGCPECGEVWLKKSHVREVTAGEHAERFRILLEIEEWLNSRKEDRTIEGEIARLTRFASSEDDFHASVRRIPERWADVLGVRTPHLVGTLRDTDIHITIEYATTNLPAPDLEGSLSNKPFFNVYRAIRRSLTRRLRKNHRHCLEKMGRSIWFPVTGRELSMRRLCPEAYALLLWRMFWENVDIPQKFFSRQLLLIRSEAVLASDRIPSGLPEEAAIRIFGMECLRTFRRCLELGASMQHKDHITFPLYRLHNDRGMEWILKVKSTGTTQGLHWWWPKRWERAHSFQRHNSKLTQGSSLKIAC